MRNPKMTVTRKKHKPEFKAEEALETLRGDRTVAGLARQYEVHPVHLFTGGRQIGREPGRLGLRASRKRIRRPGADRFNSSGRRSRWQSSR